MVEAQTVKNGGDQITRKHGALGGKAPDRIAFPITRPPFTPPPANKAVKHCGQWSRPPAGLTLGVRPNSLKAATIVLASIPRCLRSSMSAE